MKHQWRAGSAFTAAARYQDLEQTAVLPATNVSCNGLDVTQVEPFASFGPRVARTTRSPYQLFDWQVQQATRLGRHQLIVGHQYYTLDKGTRCSETFTFETFPESFDNAIISERHDDGSQTYIRDEIQLAPWLHATIGVAYQRLSYDDSTSDKVFDVGQWNPRVGVALRLTPRTLLRAAAFRQLHINLLGSTIAPPMLAGFVVARNEFPTATRDEFSVSLERSASRAFVAVRGFVRETEVPYLLDGGSFLPEADAAMSGGSVYGNWIAHRRVTLFGENQLVRFAATRFDRYDNLTKVGVNIIHPTGLFVRVSANHVVQRFSDTSVPGLPRSGFNVADAQVGYEFAEKRGFLSVRLSNAFNTAFNAIVEGLSIDRLLPRRQVVASLRWRLW
jgi:hypothetical protein